MTNLPTPSPVTQASSRVDFFPGPTRDFIGNSSCRYEVRTRADCSSLILSLPQDKNLGPTTFLGSAAATLIDYPLSAIPAVHAAMTPGNDSLAGRLSRRLAARPRRGIGLFNPPHSNVLLPDSFADLLEEAWPGLRAEFPGRPFFLRGLIRGWHGAEFARLRKLGFALIPYRRVFLFNGASPGTLPKSLKADLSQWRKAADRLAQPATPLEEWEYDRLALLYRSLYLEKYSWLNPDFTAKYLAQQHHAQESTLTVCRNESGELTGFSTFHAQERRMAAGLLGYDRAQPARPSVYTLMITGDVAHALEHRMVCNLGSGGSNYKRAKGCVVDTEFMALRAGPVSIAQALRDVLRSLGARP